MGNNPKYGLKNGPKLGLPSTLDPYFTHPRRDKRPKLNYRLMSIVVKFLIGFKSGMQGY